MPSSSNPDDYLIQHLRMFLLFDSTYLRMFLPESDNESAPSPVKSQPKVPYCKTYEQMRLEEIQAESAAYYSYEAENDAKSLFRKTKSISNRWVNSLKMEQPVKELNFQVLSLEEIRRRKKEKELAIKTLLMDTSGEIQTKPSSPIETTRTMKKRSIECIEGSSISPPKKRRTSSEFVKSSEPIIKTPPIKLRRTLKSVNISKETETESCEDTAGLVKDQGDEVSCRERLESHSNESINANRRSDVEVRLCDSSTNEEKTQTQPERATDDRKSVATYTTEDIMSVNALLAGQSYTNTEDEYLRLDYTSSDDIMRDIEDLLK